MVRITSLIGAAALFSTSVLAVPQLVARTGSSSYGSSDSSSSYDNSGYSGDSSSGYGSSNSGYGSSNSGYSSNNNGYGSSNSGYSSNDSGYGSSNSGYGSSNSGYGSSNSGYDSSNNSGYGSSNSGYGSSNNGYGSDSGYSGSDNYNTYTTTASTSIALSTSTSTIVYGSGSSNYGSGYDDCVQQCIASFAPSATGVYNAPTVDSGSSGSYGTGATKTIIVAPTQGVLRYVPFATNASIGDTIKFVWGANEHTVTKSSEFLPCNKTSDSPFASGEQNQGFVFTQVINSTDPLYFYCGTPNHCQAGMFAVINPPSSLNSPTSASGMMQSLSAQNADLKAYAALTDKATDGSAAAEWGGNIDLANVPGWAQPLVAENILYTRNLLASNPELMQTDGSIDLGSIASTPLMVPVDVAQALANAGPVPSTPAVATSVAGAAETSAPSTPNGYNNGAGSLTSPRALVGLTVVLATVFML